MARTSSNGAAQSASPKDFNEQVKRLLESKGGQAAETPKQAAQRLLRGRPKNAS